MIEKHKIENDSKEVKKKFQKKSSGSELAYAASVYLRLEGDAVTAKLMKEVAFHFSKNVNEFRKKLGNTHHTLKTRYWL